MRMRIYLIFLSFLFMASGQLLADTCTVNTDADSGGSGAAGSLRYCITRFNTTIVDATNPNTVCGASTCIITLASEIPITHSITINGSGATNANSLKVNGNASSRIFNISSGITVTINDLGIFNGSAAFGGAILNEGNLTLNYSQVGGSTATGLAGGGGIWNNDVLTLTNSTVNGNTALISDGGGIYNNFTGTVSIINSTIEGNTASGAGPALGNGGGIFMAPPPIAINQVPVVLTIYNSTISRNVASTFGGGIYNGRLDGSGIVTSTIVAGNTAGVTGNDIYDLVPGLTVDGGFDLIGTNVGNSFLPGTPNAYKSWVGTSPPINPDLGALANWGGPTDTLKILTGSVAINHGSNPLGLPFDQRGSPFVRTAGPQTDIGAFEAIGITTTASNCPTCTPPTAPLTLGSGDISDTATLSNGVETVTGSITFTLFSDSSCTNQILTYTPAPTLVSGNGSYPVSVPYTPAATGQYFWIASFTSTDGVNPNVSTSCNDQNEISQVVVLPTLITSVYSSEIVGIPGSVASVGTPIFDTATLLGGNNLTGTLTFQAFSNDTCTGRPAFTSIVPVKGDGAYLSALFTPTTPGTYFWQVTYSGDTNNAKVTTPCGCNNEASLISQATPTLITKADSRGFVGVPVFDTATLLGGANPQGSITFSIFKDDPNCGMLSLVNMSVVPVNGEGNYVSEGFAPTEPGTYYWTAFYSGDSNNAKIGPTTCGEASEITVVTQNKPSLITFALSRGVDGQPIFDTATLSGAINPEGGEIIFRLYDDLGDCPSSPIFTSTHTVTGNGAYVSDGFIPSGPSASYFWTAEFVPGKHDQTNSGVQTKCGDPNETTAVSMAQPSLITFARATAVVGGSISDSAILSGGNHPTGNITFTLYETNCDNPIRTFVIPVIGNGTYSSGDFIPTAPGNYYWAATYSGDSNNASVTVPCSTENECEASVVSAATPSLITSAHTTAVAGQQIWDTATIFGLVNPIGGTIRFRLYAPNAACPAGPHQTFDVPVTGNGTYSSPTVIAQVPGTYLWTAEYIPAVGDVNNNPVGPTPCGEANESSNVIKSTPTLITKADSTGFVGVPIFDTATLLGGVNPQGSITFSIYKDDPNCGMLSLVNMSVVPVNGEGNYVSEGFAPTEPGTYYWTAFYSGDSNNNPVATTCGVASEITVVTKNKPTLITSAVSRGVDGQPIYDTAILSGAINPQGAKIIFRLFDDLADCDAMSAPIFTSTLTVTGNGTYVSDAFIPTGPNTDYFWTAEFVPSVSDHTNSGVRTKCGDPNETTEVSMAHPSLITFARATAVVGEPIFDSAVLSGGNNPTGNITFTLFETNCENPIRTFVVPVLGNGTYFSGEFITIEPGNYYWSATYSGDANNASVTVPCSTGNTCETSVVSKATPSLITSATSTGVDGQPIFDTATLLGADNPQGTIIFRLYDDLADCNQPFPQPIAPIFTSTVTVTGNGAYLSDAFIPSGPATTYFWTAEFVPSASDNRNNGVGPTACGEANESTAVTRATPTLITKADSKGFVGVPIFDTATLLGGVNPTGSITFNIYKDDPNCGMLNLVSMSVVPVNGDGNYVSEGFVPTEPGTYYWTASYSGDSNNAAIGPTACGVASEITVVNKNKPSLITSAISRGVDGQPIYDTATLSGAINPQGGKIVFRLFDDLADCDAMSAPIFTSTLTVTGNGTYVSDAFIPSGPNTEYFWTAEFVPSGSDHTNSGVRTKCGDPNETTEVSVAQPSIITFARATAVVGEPIFDSAVLSGGNNPTGNITFTLFETNCDNPIRTFVVPVLGNGTYFSGEFITTEPGNYYWSATYSGDDNNAPVTVPCSTENECETSVVSKATPTLITSATSTGVDGQPIFDTATLLGADNPQGTIIFRLYDDLADCNQPFPQPIAPIFTSTVTVTGNGAYISDAFTPSGPATTYFWTAEFVPSASDNRNNGVGPTACGEANESTAVTRATPTLITKADSKGFVGVPIFDTATLLGGVNPQGSITFNIFKDDPNCGMLNLVFMSIVPVNGDGNYVSEGFAPTEPGTYYWTASYSGDSNNAAIGPTACGVTSEITVVTKNKPTLITSAISQGVDGQPIYDTATLSGAINPQGGKIIFRLFDDLADCDAMSAPIFTSTLTVTGNGTYVSDAFIPTGPNTDYFWTAEFVPSGSDHTNSGVRTKCGDPNETTEVSMAHPSLITFARATAVVGEPIFDSAVLSGGNNPTGNITFTLFETNCDNPIKTFVVPVLGNGTYFSGEFITTEPGNYYWSATYSGDDNNAPVTVPCSTENECETSVVSKTTPTLITSAISQGVDGQPIFDTATLLGADNPQGTIIFRLYDSLADCNANPPIPIFTSTVTVTGNGTYLSDPFIPSGPNTIYYWTAEFVPSASDNRNNGVGPTACGEANESTAVTRATPTLITNADSSGFVGVPIFDTATLLGGLNPTGSITFTLYKDDPTCGMLNQVFMDIVPVNGDGNYKSSGYIPAAPGTYYWIASYSDDANNNPVATTCGEASEITVVTKNIPTLITDAQKTAIVEQPIVDSAVLAGGINPTGTITFSLHFGTCANPDLLADPIVYPPVPVIGNGTYFSPAFIPTAPGNYFWDAVYSGDANNAPVTVACNDENNRELTVVSAATPTLITSAYTTALAGQPIFDTATILGLVNPIGGTIRFRLYAPNAACPAGPTETFDVPVTGNGTYLSPTFIAPAPGTYLWTAEYIPAMGDVNNNPVGPTACGEANEESVVNQSTPTLITDAQKTAIVGQPIVDSAVLAGGINPTGTITFSLHFGTCANPDLLADPIVYPPVPVLGNGTYFSPAFIPTAPGNYFWDAVYSGDANNAPISVLCNQENSRELTVVSAATPTLTTTASRTGFIGSPIFDVAALQGGNNPQGTITFRIYPPGSNCPSSGAIVVGVVPVNGNGNYPSPGFTPTVAGTYIWTATYTSSNSNNNSVGPTACDAPNEQTVVTRNVPTLVTSAAPLSCCDNAVGTPIFDTATLSGLIPGGGPSTITFTLHLGSCASANILDPATYTVQVDGNGTYNSPAFIPTVPGTYFWDAHYSGNANNAPVDVPCNVEYRNETTTVNRASPTVITLASPTGVIGLPIFDTATLQGGNNPTGTITFTIYPPASTCPSSDGIIVGSVPVNGNGNYTSPPFIPTPATGTGTYLWVASYSGDANNNGFTTACNAPDEQTVVSLNTPTLITSATPNGIVGWPIFDTASLLNGINPTGTITFKIFLCSHMKDDRDAVENGSGDDHRCCEGEPVFEYTTSVHGNGTYLSKFFIPEEPGRYFWTASYSGDSNNAPLSTACGDENEITKVREEEREHRRHHRHEEVHGSFGMIPLPPVPVPVPAPVPVPVVEPVPVVPAVVPAEVVVPVPVDNAEVAVPTAIADNSDTRSTYNEADQEGGGCSVVNTKNRQNPSVFFFAFMLLALWRARYFFGASKRS